LSLSNDSRIKLFWSIALNQQLDGGIPVWTISFKANHWHLPQSSEGYFDNIARVITFS